MALYWGLCKWARYKGACFNLA